MDNKNNRNEVLMTEQLIYELSFFGMVVILIGLRLWGDKK